MSDVDILGIIVSNVGAALDVPVSTETPEHPSPPYIVVQRFGGQPSRYGNYDRPIISARIHGPTEAAAYELAQAYSDAMFALTNTPHVSAVRGNAFALLSSERGDYVYQVTHAVVTV